MQENYWGFLFNGFVVAQRQLVRDNGFTSRDELNKAIAHYSTPNDWDVKIIGEKVADIKQTTDASDSWKERDLRR